MCLLKRGIPSNNGNKNGSPPRKWSINHLKYHIGKRAQPRKWQLRKTSESLETSSEIDNLIQENKRFSPRKWWF